jgi:tetraacyldisaccharide 4'-kinase
LLPKQVAASKQRSAQPAALKTDNKRFDIWQIWMRRGPIACCLWPVSLLFWFVSATRRRAYQLGVIPRYRMPVPVIIVGNLFIGGTGKTPLTIWLVELLGNAGYRPGVISRGYGSSQSAVEQVTAQSSARQVGDEPLLIFQVTGCPLMVGRNRVAAAQALLSAHPEVDVIVSDDGLQHYRLERDIEIVLSDARGEGNGWLLPAGPLREAISRKRDFSICNLGTPSQALPPTLSRTKPAAAENTARAITMHLQPGATINLLDQSQHMRLETLAECTPSPRILAAAGIGNPERFFATLTSLGLKFDSLSLPDHHVFTSQTFANYQVDMILITQKDAVKCREIPELACDKRIWIVPVSAQLEASFSDIFLEKLRGYAIA